MTGRVVAELVELLREALEDGVDHVRRGAGHVCNGCGRSWPYRQARAAELLRRIGQEDDRPAVPTGPGQSLTSTFTVTSATTRASTPARATTDPSWRHQRSIDPAISDSRVSGLLPRSCTDYPTSSEAGSTTSHSR